MHGGSLSTPSGRLLKQALPDAGNESAEASAYSSCYARVAADTYAKAAASVSISAECGYYQENRVSADVLAEVDGTIYIDEYCDLDTERYGLTEASSDGRARTRAVRSPPA